MGNSLTETALNNIATRKIYLRNPVKTEFEAIESTTLQELAAKLTALDVGNYWRPSKEGEAGLEREAYSQIFATPTGYAVLIRVEHFTAHTAPARKIRIKQPPPK